MKPTAQIGLVLAMLAGCSDFNHWPEGKDSGQAEKKAPAQAEVRASSRPTENNGPLATTESPFVPRISSTGRTGAATIPSSPSPVQVAGSWPVPNASPWPTLPSPSTPTGHIVKAEPVAAEPPVKEPAHPPENRPALSDVLTLATAQAGSKATPPAPPVGPPAGNSPTAPVALPPAAPNVVLSGPVAGDTDPAAASSVIHQAAKPAPASESKIAGLSASEIRMVNSKRISLNYAVKDVGSSGITDVELWCTRDGRTWKKQDTAHKGQPPCVIEVDDEDLYGFTLVVRSGVGLGKQPQEGDKPQVWVEVDITKPFVRLMGVEAGRGTDGRQLNIQWKVTDKNLGPKPITLFYATQVAGPWMPIAAQLENTGRYVWNMPADAPHQFFVRVEAADQAGNVGMAQTPNALIDDMSQPTTAILAVEAADK